MTSSGAGFSRSCAVVCFVFLSICGTAFAQSAAKGTPYDWSFRHVVATGDSAVTGKAPALREHRLQYAWLVRQQENRAHSMYTKRISRMSSKPQIDWDFGVGAPMADGSFPAKYNFNLPGSTPTCTDFVVYGLDTAGATGGQPNLVGLTNLYSGTANGNGLCNGNPNVYQELSNYTKGYAATLKFAYNGSTIGGAITNSVVMSEDGLKVAYVESTGTASVLHVVTLPAGNDIGAAALAAMANGYAPASVWITTAATAPASIQSVPSTGSWTAGDSYSSVWVDYQNDLAYVGTDDGTIHKIQNVFCTTTKCKASPVNPSEITTGGVWPITLAGAGPLTSPVQDVNSVIYVAAATNGNLYAISAAGKVTTSTQSFMPNSILDGPILDIDSSGTTQALYWFSNSQSAVSSPSVRQPQLVQTNSALTNINNYSLLLNGSSSWGGATAVHAGTFDNAFYTNRSGNMWACGWWQDSIWGSNANHQGVVRFALNGTTVTPDTSKVYSQTSPNPVPANINTCAPLTEVVDSTGADHIFVSSRVGYTQPVGTCITQAACVSGDVVSSTGSPAVYSLTTTASFGLNSVGNNYVYTGYTSGMIVDNNVDPTSSTCGPAGNQTCAQAASLYLTYANFAVKLTQAQLQ
jgi:hypothetical protein